ncbi:MAG: hypothetical protein GX879_06290 [Bacteroidales bacterium]|nr:hypothetical protein [Bacteroidales bacterium]
MRRFFTTLVILLPMSLLAQVKLINHDATKFYPDGTRITYLSLSEYPTDNDFISFVNTYVVKNEQIIRFSIYSNGSACFYEAMQEITEDVIVDMVNEASSEYDKYLLQHAKYKNNLKADFFEHKVKFGSNMELLKEVEFKLLFTEGKEDQISRAMLSDSKIHEFKIDSDLSGGNCTALVDFDISPESFKTILDPLNVKFRTYSIKIFDSQFVQENLPEDFPVYIDTNNPEIDKKTYLQNIDYWGKINAEFWNRHGQ